MTLYTDPLASLIYEGKPVRLPPPCPICGEVEQINALGIYVITHDYAAHGFTDRASYKVDETTLDKLGGQREA